MRIRTVFQAIILLFVAFTTGVFAQDGGDAAFEAELQQLVTTLYCYCGCEDTIIQECGCDTARTIEEEFRTQLEAGETVQHIRTDYLEAYTARLNYPHKTELAQLTGSLYCDCGECEELTILHCDCDTARAIEQNFRAQLEAGKSIEHIRADYLQTAGLQYDALAPTKNNNLVASLVTVVVLLLLGGVIIAFMRKMRQRGEATGGNRNGSDSPKPPSVPEG